MFWGEAPSWGRSLCFFSEKVVLPREGEATTFSSNRIEYSHLDEWRIIQHGPQCEAREEECPPHKMAPASPCPVVQGVGAKLVPHFAAESSIIHVGSIVCLYRLIAQYEACGNARGSHPYEGERHPVRASKWPWVRVGHHGRRHRDHHTVNLFCGGKGITIDGVGEADSKRKSVGEGDSLGQPFAGTLHCVFCHFVT